MRFGVQDLGLGNTWRNVQRFRGGLAFKAHRLCVSLNSRFESNEEREYLAQVAERLLQLSPNPILPTTIPPQLTKPGNWGLFGTMKIFN